MIGLENTSQYQEHLQPSTNIRELRPEEDAPQRLTTAEAGRVDLASLRDAKKKISLMKKQGASLTIEEESTLFMEFRLRYIKFYGTKELYELALDRHFREERLERQQDKEEKERASQRRRQRRLPSTTTTTTTSTTTTTQDDDEEVLEDPGILGTRAAPLLIPSISSTETQSHVEIQENQSERVEDTTSTSQQEEDILQDVGIILGTTPAPLLIPSISSTETHSRVEIQNNQDGRVEDTTSSQQEEGRQSSLSNDLSPFNVQAGVDVSENRRKRAHDRDVDLPNELDRQDSANENDRPSQRRRIT